MFQVDNFISFHDLSPEATFLWASSSISICLGYEPEEIVGIKPYEVIHPEDIAYVKVTHQENVLNEMVGTQVLLRMKHKAGHYVPCMVLFSLCYDYIVSCYTVVEQDDETLRKVSAHSAAMTSIVGAKQKEFERIQRHHDAFRANTWNPNVLDPEPRACMLLNRFTRNLAIMYASPSCEIIFKLDVDLIVSKPFLLFIRADDLSTFVEQVDMAKSSSVVTHMRFYFQSPSCVSEIPCEAMLFGAADAMIVILRRCKPFFRRQLITGGPPTEYWASESSAMSSSTSNSTSFDNGGFGGNGFSRQSDNNNSNISSGSGARFQYLHPQNYSGNNQGGKISTPSSSTVASSPTDSISSSTSSLSITSSGGLRGNRSYRARLRGMAIGSINNIRDLDREHSILRPLTSLHEDESDIVDLSTPLPKNYRLRAHHVGDSDLNEAELEAGVSRLRLQDEDFVDDVEEDEEGVEMAMSFSGQPKREREPTEQNHHAGACFDLDLDYS